MGVEMLRGVYPERSEWAQHDSGVVWLHPPLVTFRFAQGLAR